VSEILYMKISTKTQRVHSVRCTHYGHRSNKQGSRTSDQFICPVLEKKTKEVNAYLIKIREREKGEEEKKYSHKQSEGLGGVLRLYKVDLR